MDKRAILAFALCIAVLVLYSTFILPRIVPPKKPATPPETPPAAPQGKAEPAPETPAPKPAQPVAAPTGEVKEAPKLAAPPPHALTKPPKPAQDFILENDVLRTVWTTRGAALKSVTLKKYKDGDARHVLELLKPIQDDLFSLILTDVTTRDPRVQTPLASAEFDALPDSDGHSLTFRAALAGSDDKGELELAKTLSLEPGKYHVHVEVGLKNVAESALHPSYTLSAAAGIISESPLYDDITAIIAHGRNNGSLSVSRYPPAKLKEAAKVSQDGSSNSNIVWAGSANKYFAAVLCPKDAQAVSAAQAQSVLDSGQLAKSLAALQAGGQIGEEQKRKEQERARANAMATLRVVCPELAPQQSISQRFLFFVGPMDEAILAQYPNFSRVVDYGSFASICVLIIGMLGWFHRLIPNYGVAIILLTILVKLVLHPLTRKSQVSMYRMQQLQPKINELREKYKSNKQKQGQEQMALFKEHGVNPMSGCLPILLQLPVFLALFNALRVSISLRQAPFVFWIKDLSRADTIGMFGTIPINIMPVIMTITWFYQQKTMPQSTDPQMAQQQKIMKFMPIFFGFLLYSMPAGLTLYWLVSTLLGIGEQYIIRKSLDKLKAQTA